MQDTLADICATLDKLTQNQDARIYVSGQHALDESLVFGTTDAYLRLASELIKFVVAAQRNEVDRCESDGIAVQTSPLISGVFDACSEIRFDNSDLVSTEAEARQLFEYWWGIQQDSILTQQNADYSGEHFRKCDFSNVEIEKSCKTVGMKINGILLQDLLDHYNDKSK